jgi:hypothetical protein
MLGQFYQYHMHQPSSSEVNSWNNSLPVLAEVAARIGSDDVGVILEYHVPLAGFRIDALFLGRDELGRNNAVAVELKQWSDVVVPDVYSLNVTVGGREYAHPSQQASDYAGFLSDIHSGFVEGAIRAHSCAFLHNLHGVAAGNLVRNQFEELVEQSPLFTSELEDELALYLSTLIGHGGGASLCSALTSGQFQPSKKLLSKLEATIDADETWDLIDQQREAYNEVLSSVRRLEVRNGRAAVLVRGGPGTGKTVIAIQLLSDALRLGMTAAHSTGSKAFTTALRSKFKGADKLFIWNKDTRNATPHSIDLLLVDEAHRVRETSDTRWTPSADRNRKSQMQELLDAAKVTVFFLDENQYVRPDEIGCSDLVRSECNAHGVKLSEFDLESQFRCGGCREYVNWVDHLLGFEVAEPRPWGQAYSVQIESSPIGLEQSVYSDLRAGRTARMVAGFCWKWSDRTKGGGLVDDVTIGDWERPWNPKEEKSKRYRPENHPYTIWAEQESGREQIGCIYSAQGFEFDSVGLIWGLDLVWRQDKWVAQKSESFDRPVKTKNADTLRLVRNAYRVLMTRGIYQTHLLILDPETRNHVEQQLGRNLK